VFSVPVGWTRVILSAEGSATRILRVRKP